MGFVVFIVCCHFISLYYLPREGPLLLLQAVQKALSRLILSFCKDNHFFWESIFFLLFFFSFFAPMIVAFAPMFVAFAPMFVAFAPMFVAFGSTFVAFAPMIVAFAPMIVAFASTFVVFAPTTKFVWEHHQKIQNPYRKSVHILGFSVTKGSPFYAICDVLVNTCEGRVHALNPLCLSDFRSRCEGWTLVSCFIRMRERK